MYCSFFPIFRALFTLDNCNTGKENVNVDRIFRLFLVYLISNVTWPSSIVNQNWFQNKPFFQVFPEIFISQISIFLEIYSKSHWGGPLCWSIFVHNVIHGMWESLCTIHNQNIRSIYLSIYLLWFINNAR